MDVEDPDLNQTHHVSRRESPSSNLDEAGQGAQFVGKESLRRSKSRRSRNEAHEERRRLSSRHRSNQNPQHDGVEEPSLAIKSRGTDRVRHKKKKVRSRGEDSNFMNETPITKVLHELQDDVQDISLSNAHGAHQSSYHGENEPYTIHKGRDCIYVERYDGFTSVSRDNALVTNGEALQDEKRRWFDLSSATALDVAIQAQKIWIPLADFCHGLLAGMALMQAILVDRLLGPDRKEASHFVSLYCNFSLIFTSTFYLLTCVSLISVLDRLDLARSDWPLLMDLLSVRPRLSWLIIPVYGMGLLFTLSAAKGDNWIHLSQYSSTNSSSPEAMIDISQTDLDMLSSWHVLNSLRCACVIFGWLLISVSHPPDLLLRLLESMMVHTQNKTQLYRGVHHRSTIGV